MKKIYMLFLILLVANLAFSQSAICPPRHLLNQSIKTEYVQPGKDLSGFTNGFNPAVNPPIRSVDEQQLGTSFYDLQSNYMIQNRICFIPEDNTIGVVWTKGMTPDAFSDRGTGYNYFDGTSWLPEPDVRIEDERTGWPNYALWGASGEIVISHLASGLKISTREQRGTGEWTFSTLMGPAGAPDLTWPRMITSGEDHTTIHLLANTYDAYLGQTEAILYYRSLDGGQTWDIEGELLDGLGADYYTEIGADAYAWAEAKGDTIAFLVASAWHDAFVMKSFDNGDSWDKIMIWEHPYPFFDWEVTLADTFFCFDNSGAIAIDNEGKAHTVFGINRAMHMELGTSYNFFPFVDGICYWNEDMEPFSNDLSALAPPQYGYPTSEMIEDVNYIGYTQDVDGDGEITFITTPTGFPMSYRTIGLSTFPALTIDSDGNIFVVFSSTTETYDNFEYNFKHIWSRAWSSYSESWMWFTDLTSNIIHIFDEFYFPQLAPYSDDYVHMVWNIDASPGIAWSGQHDYIENRLNYVKVDKSDLLPVGIGENPGQDEFTVSQNYPNPVVDKSYFRVDVTEATDLSYTISDITGKEIYRLDKGRVNAGGHYFEINAEDYSPGIYFYIVKAGGMEVSKKMIVK